MVETDRPQMTCWISKATDTHLEYVILLLLYSNKLCARAPQGYVIREFTPMFKERIILNRLVSELRFV